jgi:hypothetical protein
MMSVVEMEAPEGPDLEALAAELKRDIDLAVEFLDEAFSADREKAERYYNGECDVPVDGNRSAYVATKLRDTVRGVRPSLLRLFLGSVSPVEYRPSGKVSAALARQQTTYIEQQFEIAGGYMALRDAFDMSMLHKVGPVRFDWKTYITEDYRTYTNLNAEQFQSLQATPNIRIVSVETTETTVMGPSGELTPEPIYQVDLAYQTKSGRPCLQPVLLNNFIIDDGAVNGQPPRVIGTQQSMTVSDILTTYPDIDPEQLQDLSDEEPETNRNTGESKARRSYIRRNKSKDPVDPSMRKVLITDVYWAADLDGSGIAQMWRWILGGRNRTLLSYERAEDGHNFALFQIDPKAGAVFGESISDITMSEQDGLSSLTRTVIDNAHASNHPRLAYHETMVNQDDVANFDIAHPIRFRQPGMIQAITVPFTGGQTMPFLEYWNNDVENKTGVSRASLGLDPRALQSTDKEAVRNTIAAGAGQIESMARNLAETGMQQLFRGLLRLCMRHQDPHQVMWITGEQYVNVDLQQFDPTLNIRVNVGLGGGNDDERVMKLEKVMAIQEKIIGQFGAGNPVVLPHHVTQTMEDYIKALGFKDTSRYIQPLTPEQGQQMSQQAQEAAQQPPPPDPALQTLKEIEGIKSQARMAEATGKAQLEAQQTYAKGKFEMAEAARKDDLERDKMLQDLAIAVAEIMLQGGQLDVQKVLAAQKVNTPSGVKN